MGVKEGAELGHEGPRRPFTEGGQQAHARGTAEPGKGWFAAGTQAGVLAWCRNLGLGFVGSQVRGTGRRPEERVLLETWWVLP